MSLRNSVFTSELTTHQTVTPVLFGRHTNRSFAVCLSSMGQGANDNVLNSNVVVGGLEGLRSPS